MNDNSISGVVSLAAGGTVANQGLAASLPFSEVLLSSVLAMIITGLITWGMFKKTTEKNEAELALLREHQETMLRTLYEVRERVARIEGRLEQTL
jgi:hypothetical protein